VRGAGRTILPIAPHLGALHHVPLRAIRFWGYETRVQARHSLASAFLTYAPASFLETPTPHLERELQARLEAGCVAWSNLALEPLRFVQHLAERSHSGLPPVERAADLFIACACMCDVPAAVAAFGRRYRAVIARAVARTDASEAFLDDVVQALGVRLFVRTGEALPSIAQYNGRSSLGAWLATAATRTARNLRRRKCDQQHDEVPSGISALKTAADPELLLLKARYTTEFEGAIRSAFASLPAGQRMLLLLQAINGLTLPQLAAVHRVSRATVARRLAAARQTLFEQTRSAITKTLQLSPSEYNSVLELVRSQIDLGLAAVVATELSEEV
jgi:RNA polymerase sigma-70 factor (ECF subfamily)